MATKVTERPLPFSLAFFQRMTQHITEHYDAGAHEDRDGNKPCEDEYCKAEPTDATVVKAMFESMEPLLWDFLRNYDFTDHDSFEDLRNSAKRASKHQHECGQRMTGGAVVVSNA